MSVSGGEKDNAIAKQCAARLVVPEEKTASFEDAVQTFEIIVKKGASFYGSTDAYLCGKRMLWRD